jgi:hypothetical protein
MNNYNEFISQVGCVSTFPKNVYRKVRFRIITERVAFPASLALLILSVFTGIILFNDKNYEQDFDIAEDTEWLIFAQSDNFYSIFDDK